MGSNDELVVAGQRDERFCFDIVISEVPQGDTKCYSVGCFRRQMQLAERSQLLFWSIHRRANWTNIELHHIGTRPGSDIRHVDLNRYTRLSDNR